MKIRLLKILKVPKIELHFLIDKIFISLSRGRKINNNCFLKKKMFQINLILIYDLDLNRIRSKLEKKMKKGKYLRNTFII